MDNSVLPWLLGKDNPCVRLRTLQQLPSADVTPDTLKTAKEDVLATLDAARDNSWTEGKGLAVIYKLTALSEAGLAASDLPVVNGVVDRLLQAPFDAGCGDFMLLRALVMLGYGEDARIQQRILAMKETQLSDGGWLCLHRLKKYRQEPKSCIKAAMHALMASAEMKLRNIEPDAECTVSLICYFTKRRLLYRMDDPEKLVLDCRPGWRMTDVFFPPEVMRVGLPMLLAALAILGAGQSPELNEAWELMESKIDDTGKLKLEGTLTDSYLPREKVGQPSKWATFYAYLANQYR